VPAAIEQARDRDRIPLQPGGNPPAVDILVPDQPADLPGLFAENGYGWVAFVRRGDVRFDEQPPAEPTTETVEVRYHRGAVDDAIDDCERGEVPGTPVLPKLSYPEDGWEYPGGATAGTVGLVDDLDVEVIAIARSPQRRPLAALRASLFLASLPLKAVTSPDVRHVHTVVPAKPLGSEMIVVVQPLGGGEEDPEPEPIVPPPPPPPQG
jgi:hypothetical protein